MTNRRTRLAAPTALISLCVLVATCAHTDAVRGQDNDDAAEIAFIQTAKQTLIDAIKTAEKRAKGFAFEAVLEIDDGKAIYEVETTSALGVFEVTIDADTGMVTLVEPEGDDEQEAGALRSSGDATMIEAVLAAQEAQGGKAIEAEWDGRQAYEIELASTDGLVTTVSVNAQTRMVQVLSDEDEMSDD